MNDCVSISLSFDFPRQIRYTVSIDSDAAEALRAEVNVVTGAKRDNIVFLPQTVRFYEEQLAAALQAERYAQAVQMLNDVLSIQGIDAHKRREWERLLDGIK